MERPDSPADPPAAIKRLGQNFLIDPNIVRKIVALAEIASNSHVLEIGPGRGVLTEVLCKTAGLVTAVEIDPRLHAYLAERQAEFPNLTLVLDDALVYPVESLPAGTIVVANLPRLHTWPCPRTRRCWHFWTRLTPVYPTINLPQLRITNEAT